MISLNAVVDFCDDTNLNNSLAYVQKTRQKSIVIGGGAQMDRLINYIERVRVTLPNIEIQMRILEDTGIMVQLTPAQWFNRYVTPRYEWLKRNRVKIVVDNETAGDDGVIRKYVGNSIEVARMLHAVQLNGIFCRFATGTIDDGGKGSNQYPLLKPLLAELNDGDGIGPNEYTNAPGKSSGGHLERYKRILAVSPKPLNVSIGECGILNDYRARSGYRQTPMSDETMAAQLIADEIWYNGGRITRHAFVRGGGSEWVSLQIGDGALAFWTEYYAKMPPPDDTPTVPSPGPKTGVISLSELLLLRRQIETNAANAQKAGVLIAQLYEAFDNHLTVIDNWIKQIK